MSHQIDIVASYWSIAAGAEPHTDHEFSPRSFRDRVSVAAKAGFTGIGIWHADLEHVLKTSTLKEMNVVLKDHGIKHVELEFLCDWWFRDGPREAECDARKRLLFEAAAAFGAHHVKVGDFFNTPCSIDELTTAFAALCKEAEGYGTDILFELMPFANIHTLPDTLTLLEGANAGNGGVIIDLWHMVKMGVAFSDVAAIPSQFLGGIEINDGTFTAPWSLHEDTINHRRLCGEGEFDVKGFVTAMLDAGYKGPWGVEVLNKDLRSWPLEKAAEAVYRTTRAQFPA